MKRATILAMTTLAALTLVVALAAPAGAIHSWGGYHWARTANPFTLKLGDNVSSAWDSYLATASSDWSKSNVLDTTVVAGQSKGNCRATSGRVEVCSKSYGYNGWLGLAQIWISGKHITQGVVKVNDSYFSLAQYNNPDERQHVMCQEIGHTFGLGHTSEDGSSQGTCMDYSNSPNSTAPNQHDWDQLATIYAHNDSFTTIQSSASGKGSSTSVRDDGNGQKVVTFIIYA